MRAPMIGGAPPLPGLTPKPGSGAASPTPGDAGAATTPDLFAALLATLVGDATPLTLPAPASSEATKDEAADRTDLATVPAGALITVPAPVPMPVSPTVPMTMDEPPDAALLPTTDPALAVTDSVAGPAGVVTAAATAAMTGVPIAVPATAADAATPVVAVGSDLEAVPVPVPTSVTPADGDPTPAARTPGVPDTAQPVFGSARQAGVPTDVAITTLTPGSTAGSTAGTPASAEPATGTPASTGVPIAALTSNAPVAPSAGPAVMTQADGSAAEQVARVLDSQVARIAHRGDGTHRLSLTLYPAALGEVQVTLTVRDGAVSVTLAAGAQAQAALVADSAELHRLLARATSGPTEITVQNLSGTAASGHSDSDSTSSSGSTADDSAQARAQTEPETSDHHHARTRGGTPHSTELARDGDAREHPAPGAPTIRPGTRPPTGVDVTM